MLPTPNVRDQYCPALDLWNNGHAPGSKGTDALPLTRSEYAPQCTPTRAKQALNSNTER